MPIADLRHVQGPTIGFKDVRTITLADLSGDDYVDDRGFCVVAGSAGNITYRTLEGNDDQVLSGLSAGDRIAHGTSWVIVRAVRQTGTTVTSIVVAFA